MTEPEPQSVALPSPSPQDGTRWSAWAFFLGTWAVLLALLAGLFALGQAAGTLEHPLGRALGGEASHFAITGLQVLIFLLLAQVAYLGQRSGLGQLVAVLVLLLAGLLAGAGTVVLVGLNAVDFQRIQAQQAAVAAGQKPADRGIQGPLDLLQVGGARAISRSALATLAVLVAALLCLVGGVRRWAATYLPIDPRSFVHAMALSIVVAMIGLSFVPLLILGEPPILLLLRNAALPDLNDALKPEQQLRMQFYLLVWVIPVALLAVDYPVSRSLAEASHRLGFIRPSKIQILGGIAAAVLLAAVMLGVDAGIGWAWTRLGWPRTDAATFEKLLQFALNPLGAVVIGISAGVGEELAVRGVLQPRLGILMSNLAFTAMHAMQYHLDGLLSVFLLGLVLGVVRQRTNTSTSAIIHGTYDFLLVMGAWLGLPGFG